MAAGREGLLPASFPFSSLPRFNRQLAEEEQDDADLLADAMATPAFLFLHDAACRSSPQQLLATVDVTRERPEYLCSLVLSNKVENITSHV
uniref:Uncharacterized protein n=1 Tax=Oryza barthii TaxID=65489 RepID=A0A0D3H1J7_9ORYZ